MLTPDDARQKLDELVKLATAKGASAADAVYVGERSQGVTVRMGDLEDVHRSEGEQIGLRLFRGQKSASVSGAAMDRSALDELVDRAFAMAGEAPDDPYAGLAPQDMLLKEPPVDLDLDDGGDPDPAVLREQARIAEEAARSVAGVTNSNGGSASASASTFAIATSHGFSGASRATGYSCSASVVAGEGSGMQRDYAWHSARYRDDLEAAEDIGRRASERAVARLNPVRVKPGKMPVLFDPRVATTLLGHFLGAISGAAIARQASFLLDALGKPVFGKGVTIHDDPFRPRGLRSRAFDGEGLPVRSMRLVDEGVLTGWLAESASARQLGIAPTGHAIRGASGAPGAGPANLYIDAGDRSREEMIADVPYGIYVTELIGQGVNGVTGDYSRGAAGFLIEHGALGPAVAEITVASNLKDMFATLEPATDLAFRRGIDSPTILVPDMVVASA